MKAVGTLQDIQNVTLPPNPLDFVRLAGRRVLGTADKMRQEYRVDREPARNHHCCTSLPKRYRKIGAIRWPVRTWKNWRHVGVKSHNG